MVQSKENQRDGWLTPSIALNRFTLRKGVATGLKKSADKQLRYGFRIAGIGLLIAQGAASELMDLIPIYPLPHTPGWLVGLINLRGNLVPIFNLKQVLELEEIGQEKQRILILDKGDRALGVLIDDFPQIADTTRTLSRLPPLPAILRPYVQRAYAEDRAVWLELDHHGFFQSLTAQIGTSA